LTLSISFLNRSSPRMLFNNLSCSFNNG
jgi:hypothetical protein